MANQVLTIADLHVGCQTALCPPEGFLTDSGGRYLPSPVVLKLWALWVEFWEQWVPQATRGKPFVLVVNGDALDGVHHGSTHQWSHNLEDQRKAAESILRPCVDLAETYYHIRGTEAHVGQCGENEEALARALGAEPTEHGQFARYDLWLRCGGKLIQFMHHIGTTGSAAYEATAVNKERVEIDAEAARWGLQTPDVVVRSHRHRNIEVAVPTARGRALAVVTGAWQLKTPFAWKVAGARISEPQIGGSLIRIGDDGEVYAQHYTRTIGRSREESA